MDLRLKPWSELTHLFHILVSIGSSQDAIVGRFQFISLHSKCTCWCFFLLFFFYQKHHLCWYTLQFNTLRPTQNGPILQTTHSNTFSCTTMYEFRLKCQWILFLREINNIPSLVQRMACRRPGDRPLTEPMTHIRVTRPQSHNRTNANYQIRTYSNDNS